jgi:hypothetical protein
VGAGAKFDSASMLLGVANDGGCSRAVAVFEGVLSNSGSISLPTGRLELRGWEKGELGR